METTQMFTVKKMDELCNIFIHKRQQINYGYVKLIWLKHTKKKIK